MTRERKRSTTTRSPTSRAQRSGSGTASGTSVPTAATRSPKSGSKPCPERSDASDANDSSKTSSENVLVAALEHILQDAARAYVASRKKSLRRYMLFVIWRKGVHILLTADGCKCGTSECFLRKSEANQEALLADSPVSFKQFLSIFEKGLRKKRKKI